jgi:catechol 2,3-dioxygenase-like lactoylglutathione lyase family enzyme
MPVAPLLRSSVVLHHVSIEVAPADLRRSVELWEMLGFEPVAAPEALGGYVTWLEHEGTQVHLIHTDGAMAPALGHAAVVTPDIARTVARLRDAGFEVEEAQELWGQPRAFVVGPGGHRIELMAAPP